MDQYAWGDYRERFTTDSQELHGSNAEPEFTC
jgi:hypothetical protein